MSIGPTCLLGVVLRRLKLWVRLVPFVAGSMALSPHAAARGDADDIEQTKARPVDPMVSYVDYESEAKSGLGSTQMAYPDNGVIPDGYVVKERRRLVSWLPGALAVVVLPLAGVGVAASTTMDSTWIPVAGPFMALGEYKHWESSDNSVLGLGHLGAVFVDIGTYALLVLDGAAQVTGWGLLGYSWANPDGRYLVREDVARSYVLPTLLRGGVGLNWVGTF